MNILAALKYAVNSTIGTSDFKSLDNIIKDNVRLVQTNDVFYSGNFTFTGSPATSTKGLTFDCGGTVQFVIPRSAYASGNVTYSVMRGSTTVSSLTSSVGAAYISANIEKGVEYKFRISDTGTSSVTLNVEVRATPVQGAVYAHVTQ